MQTLRLLKEHPIKTITIGIVAFAATGYILLVLNFPGSGFSVQKSDGLVKGIPLGIKLNLRIPD